MLLPIRALGSRCYGSLFCCREAGRYSMSAAAMLVLLATSGGAVVSQGDGQGPPKVAIAGPVARPTMAQQGETRSAPSASQGAEPHTVFQAGIGLLALPAAKVCPTLSRCEPGETSFALSLRSLGRYRNFGFGAGIHWGFGLRPSDDIRADVEGSLERRHSRSYFIFDGEFRYYLPAAGKWEWWTGASAGLVVVNDSWTTLADREPYADTAFVGPRAMTLATEGLSVGLGVGGHWRFSEHWIFGTRFRYANWFLPEAREVTPMGDSSSLAGRIDVFDFGLVVGFRLSL